MVSNELTPLNKNKESMSILYSRISLAWAGLGPWKLFLAKGSSSHSGWIMHKMILRIMMIVLAGHGEWAIRVWAIEISTVLCPEEHICLLLPNRLYTE